MYVFNMSMYVLNMSMYVPIPTPDMRVLIWRYRPNKEFSAVCFYATIFVIIFVQNSAGIIIVQC